MELKYSDIKDGDKIKFVYYSSMHPYPKCTGVVKHVWGVGYLTSLMGKSYFQIDVVVSSVEGKYYQDLVGKTVRIRNDFDIEVL